jgi:hypothetical protein
MRNRWAKGGNKELRTIDKWFSWFIRLRDTDDNGGAVCITCNKYTPWDRLDCGHCETRNKISVRFDEKNAHAQCRSCNRFKGGEQQMHRMYIRLRYGNQEADLLLIRAASIKKYLPYEKKEMSAYFRTKAKELYSEKSDFFKEMYKL